MSKHKKGFFRKYPLRYSLSGTLFLAGLASCSIALLSVLRLAVRYLSTWLSRGAVDDDTRKDDITSSSSVSKILRSNDYGTHKFVQLKNVKLHYVENGDASKPLIIFVHSFKELWYFWKDQLVHYGQDFWTVAVDLRGYGSSEKSSDLTSYKLKTLTKDLKDLIGVLNRTDKKRKVILIGHGWGGIIVHDFVRRHSDLVERYITFGAVPPDCLDMSVKQLMKLWYVYFIQLPLLPEYYFLSFKMKLFFDDDFLSQSDANVVEAYKYAFSKPGVMTCVLNHYRANAWRIGSSTIYGFPSIGNSANFPPGLLIRSAKEGVVDKSSFENATKVQNLTVVNLDDYSYRYLLTKRWSASVDLVDKFLDAKSLTNGRRHIVSVTTDPDAIVSPPPQISKDDGSGDDGDDDDKVYPLMGDVR